jgi:hypothetical protein
MCASGTTARRLGFICRRFVDALGWIQTSDPRLEVARHNWGEHRITPEFCSPLLDGCAPGRRIRARPVVVLRQLADRLDSACVQPTGWLAAQPFDKEGSVCRIRAVRRRPRKAGGDRAAQAGKTRLSRLGLGRRFGPGDLRTFYPSITGEGQSRRKIRACL